MSLTRYLLRRLLVALLLIFVVSSAAFLLTLAAPGACSGDELLGVDPALVASRCAALGLDRPALVQYGAWIGRAIRFDFGQSLLYTRPVADLLGERALNTAVLAIAALTLATAIGIPLGIYSGRRQRGMGHAIVRGASLILLSTPPLVASLTLVLIASRTQWMPVGGMMSGGSTDAGWWPWLADVARHVPLPALALALPLAAILERLQAQALRAAIEQPFVQAARARGLSPVQADLAHAWRVSLASVLGLYGVMIGALFSGSFVVEVVTAWPGLGRLMFDALRARDLFLVAGCAAAGASSLSVGTVLSDAMLAIADPRVRLRARE